MINISKNLGKAAALLALPLITPLIDYGKPKPFRNLKILSLSLSKKSETYMTAVHTKCFADCYLPRL